MGNISPCCYNQIEMLASRRRRMNWPSLEKSLLVHRSVNDIIAKQETLDNLRDKTLSDMLECSEKA